MKTLTKILEEYREGKRGLPTYQELLQISAALSTQETDMWDQADEMDDSRFRTDCIIVEFNDAIDAALLESGNTQEGKL